MRQWVLAGTLAPVGASGFWREHLRQWGFLIPYSIAIHEIFYEAYLKAIYSVLGFKLNPIKLFSGNTILGINCSNMIIDIGDRIIVKKHPGQATEKFFDATIEEIGIDNKTYTKAYIQNSTDVALKLSQPVKLNQEFFILKK